MRSYVLRGSFGGHRGGFGIPGRDSLRSVARGDAGSLHLVGLRAILATSGFRA